MGRHPPGCARWIYQPVGIGKLATVNTADPVDVGAIAAAVHAHLPGSPGKDHFH